MANAPRWKVYDRAGNYQAAVKEPEAAAALVSFYGYGTTIRAEHAKSWIVWEEGSESVPASESYDIVAETCYRRLHEKQAVIESARKRALDLYR